MGSVMCKCNEEGKDKEVNFNQEKNQFVDLITENMSLKRELNEIKSRHENNLGVSKKTPNQVGEFFDKLESSNKLEPFQSNLNNNSFIQKVQTQSKPKSSLNISLAKPKSEFQSKRELEELNSRIKIDNTENTNNPNSSFELKTGGILRSHLEHKADNLALNVKINKESKINVHLLRSNNNQLILNEDILSKLDSDCIIFDIEMKKIKLFKNELKVTERYCLITKEYFKYFNSMYSSTVWQDKPLIRLPLRNICKLHLGRNSDRKLRENHNIEMILHIHFRFDQHFQYNPNYEVVTYTDAEGERVNILEFGVKEEEDVLNLIKIMTFMRKLR